LHYKRYLTEVERILKQDPHFRAKLKNATIDDLMVGRACRLRSHPVLTCTLTRWLPALQAGKLSKELDSVCHDVRSKLDELKREELNRLRTLLKAKHAIAQEKGHAVDHQVVLKQFAYLNLVNSEKFDVDDLDRLIAGVGATPGPQVEQVNQHVEQLDESRRQEYKRYQMMKEHERREYLRALSQEQRQQEEERRQQEEERKQADHPRINHPGSEDQLKEVWEETDGLDPDDFDPKTFFKLHGNVDAHAPQGSGGGVPGDRPLWCFRHQRRRVPGPGRNGGSLHQRGSTFLTFCVDPPHTGAEPPGTLSEPGGLARLHACVLSQLKKVYAEDTDDNAEQTELERTRMRNHLLAEVDANKDRLVSLSEFLESTQILPERGVGGQRSPSPPQTSDQKPLFSEEELREFEQRLAEENSALSRKAEELQKALLQQEEEEVALQRREEEEVALQRQQ
ncbi:unnamed protein product, partial [Tetraodon nigroviridis]